MWLLAALLLSQTSAQVARTDPSEYFQGALQRPRLEILSPENGEVLDSGNLDIRISVSDYDLKARYVSPTVCVALSSSDLIAERCFDDSDVVFHAENLEAGRQYSLRIVLFERGDGIAVSVRSFRVAGVETAVGSGEMVTIQSAIQVAMQLQTTGMEKEAEEIYRSILSEISGYPDALHLLGVSLFQQGDPEEAVSYIERALQSGKSYEGFHNSLGECYRILGRIEAARAQFELALALNPLYKSAMFNMGLVFQQQKQWREAIEQFHLVANFASVVDGASSIFVEGSAELQLAEESKIRECDLLQSLDLLHQVMQCWSEGIKLFPSNHHLFNGLGTSHAEGGDYETAYHLFLEADSLGSQVADFNAGHMLELQGFVEESRKTFESSLARADSMGSTGFHIRLRLATLLPRIIPGEEELTVLRTNLEKALDGLLAFEGRQVVDNASPLHFGYSLLSHLAYHGRNNLHLKLKLGQVYLKLCPTLKNAVFLDKYEDAVSSRRIGGVAQIADSSSRFKMDSVGKRRRIGFASRFLAEGHASGELVQGVIRQLAIAGFDVFVFFIDGPDSLGVDDPVRSTISASAHSVFQVPIDIAKAAEVIRAQRLDILVYPDVGLEPVCYFMAFARLAPVQIAWLGHPDTTGIVDYFLTSDSEEKGTDRYYSEKLIRMKGFGTHFVRHVTNNPEGNDRNIVLETLKIPKVAHLYVVISHLSRLGPLFDTAIAKILQMDRTGYVVIADSGRQRKSLEQIFLARLAQQAGGVITRVVFFSSAGLAETRQLIRSASVVLDPFPSGGLVGSLQAISLGVPVVTLPTDRIAGRTTLGLYRIMDYTPSSLVVNSSSTFVSAALSIAHQPILRRTHVDSILEKNSKLFPPLLNKETGEASSETLELQKEWTALADETLRRSNK